MRRTVKYNPGRRDCQPARFHGMNETVGLKIHGVGIVVATKERHSNRINRSVHWPTRRQKAGRRLDSTCSLSNSIHRQPTATPWAAYVIPAQARIHWALVSSRTPACAGVTNRVVCTGKDSRTSAVSTFRRFLAIASPSPSTTAPTHPAAAQTASSCPRTASATTCPRPPASAR